jgi:hypothetical protein
LALGVGIEPTRLQDARLVSFPYYSPLFDYFANGWISFNVYHHSTMVMGIVNEMGFGDLAAYAA